MSAEDEIEAIESVMDRYVNELMSARDALHEIGKIVYGDPSAA